MKVRLISVYLMLIYAFFIVGLNTNALAQEDEISAPDFKRPAARAIAGEDIASGSSVIIIKKNSNPPKKPTSTRQSNSNASALSAKAKKPVFRLQRTNPRPKPFQNEATNQTSRKQPLAQQSKLTVDSAKALNFEQLGVTFWRLRPKKPGERGESLSVALNDGTQQLWIPERVPAATQFRLNDLVRISIESPRQGYLYIIDQEIYSDGTLGEAKLIFPTRRTRGGDNQVRAGLIIDLPSQSDRIPYFKVTSNDSRYRGEKLTVLVAPEPIQNLPIKIQPATVAKELLASLTEKFGVETKEYEQIGSAGKTYTKAEKEASGVLIRQLTQDDPLPQTVYRFQAEPNKPFLFNLNLLAR